MTVNTNLTTVFEFLKLPNPPGGHGELHHGHVVVVPNRKRPLLELEQRLLRSLLNVTSGRGFVANQFPFRPLPQFEFWQADIGFVVQDRWARDSNDYFQGAPDFVIELSPKYDTLERQQICLENGCKSFWTVDSTRRTVAVTTPDWTTVMFDRCISLPEPLEGIVELQSVFAARSVSNIRSSDHTESEILA